MVNGVEIVNGEHREEDMKVEGGDGDLKLESADAGSNGLMQDSMVEESKGLVRDAEEDDVQTAASMEQECFYTPAYQHRDIDLQESVFDAMESADGFDGEENGDGSSDQNPDREDEELADNLNAVDVRLNDKNAEEQQAISSGEKMEAFDGEVSETKLNGIEDVEGSYELHNDGEKIPENGEKKLIEEKPENGECNGVDLDEGHVLLHEEVENGVSHVDTSDEMGVDTVTESKEQTPSDEVAVDIGTKSKEQTSLEGLEQMGGDSVGLYSPSNNGQIINMQREVVEPQSNLSKTDNGIIGKTYAPVVKEGTSQGKQEQAKAEGSSSSGKSGVRDEFDRESVLVEDLSDSSSTDDDYSRTSSQPAPTASSPAHLESSGGPSLPSRPAGLGFSAPLLEPAPRSLQQSRVNGVAPQRQSQLSEEASNDDSEENDETREKLQKIRVKFLRLAHRLGQTPHNVVVAQVLYRLGLAEQLRRNTNRPGVFSFDRASVMAEQLEASGKEPLDFSCTIMVIGKTGVGKSATINSIFDEVKLHTDAFQVATKKVQEIVGTVQGIKVRIIDTPGLLPSSSDQWHNEKILRSVKQFISQSPPDIVLYFDRLDMQSRDYGDVPLLQSITNIFGSSIWFNAITVLTHAASAPPDGPNDTPLSYEMFVSQRSHVVQQAIRQAAQDLRLMNPVSLVENHSACRMNRAGQRVLPNGQVWKPHLLLLSFASKILAEANMLLQLQDAPPGRPFGARARAPPLPFFLSSLLQSRPQLKLPEEQFGDDFNGDEDLDKAPDLDDGSDYDELPPFRTLNKSQLAKLSKLQRKAYFEELDYREKLFFRKQLKEEKRRLKLMKKMADETNDLSNDYNNENVEDENSSPASVPVLMPDLALPTSFDSDNPTHRYRFLDTSNQWVVRPVLENHVWDHDVGYDGLNVERLFAVKDKIPVSVSGQLTKDKKECTFQMELASSIKHGDAGASSLGLDMQTVGKDMSYTLRGETRIKNFRRNNTAAGISMTLLGDAMSAGVKIEDNLVVNKRLRLLMSGGAMTGRGDVAYGGRLEATLRDKDYPLGQTLSSLALSVMDWHGDLAIGCNLQSQIPLGRGTNIVSHANLNNKGTGQVGIRLNSSEQLQIALLALVPVFKHVKRMLFGSPQLFD